MTRGRWHIIGPGARMARALDIDGRTVYTLTVEKAGRQWWLSVFQARRAIYSKPAPTLAQAQALAERWQP